MTKTKALSIINNDLLSAHNKLKFLGWRRKTVRVKGTDKRISVWTNGQDMGFKHVGPMMEYLKKYPLGELYDRVEGLGLTCP